MAALNQTGEAPAERGDRGLVLEELLLLISLNKKALFYPKKHKTLI